MVTPEGAKWRLLFRASRPGDGHKPTMFHRKCDGVEGGTVVLVHGTSEDGRQVVCGGYTAVPWDSPRRPGNVQEPAGEPHSFLFCLADDAVARPVRLPVLTDGGDVRAARHVADFGPIFGSGDLRVGGHSDLLERLGSRTHTAAPSASYDASGAVSAGCLLFKVSPAAAGAGADGEAGGDARGPPGKAVPVKFTAADVEVFGIQGRE